MPEKMNVKVSAPDAKKDVPPISIRPNLEGVIYWIKAKRLDPYTEAKMIKKAKRWPHEALSRFVEKFRDHVIKAQEGRINE